MKESDPATFEEVVRKKCQWYYDLLPIFRDRASAGPKCTNEDLSDSDDGEETEQEENSSFEAAAAGHMLNESVEAGTPSGAISPLTADTGQETTTESTTNLETAGAKEAAGETTVGLDATTTRLSIVPTVSSKTSSCRSATKHKRKRTNISSDDVLSAGLQGFTDAANQRRQDALKEQQRHNRKMEEFAQWDGMSKKLQYKMELLDRYTSLKERGFTNEFISKNFPEMKAFFDSPIPATDDSQPV